MCLYDCTVTIIHVFVFFILYYFYYLEISSKTSSMGPKKMEKNKSEEKWEDEVEGLVMWSTKLDQEKLD